MKLAVLFSVILFPMSFFAQKNYAPINAEWKYEGHSIDCSGFHQRFTVEDEVIVQGKDCSVIIGYIWDDEINNWEPTGDSLIVWEEERKVYFLENDSFYLLYNFAPELNDTIIYFDPINRGLFSSTESEIGQEAPNQLACVIKNIEEVEITSGQILKRFQTENLYGDSNCTELGYVLENIGSLSQGITGDFCYNVTMGCFGGFVCYSNEEIEIRSELFSCELFTGFKDLNLENGIEIFPNPTESSFSIETPRSLINVTIEIYNSNGQFLFREQIQKKISVQNLETGVYLVRLFSDGKYILTKKIVKQ